MLFKAPCRPGTFSDTGYEPCSFCDVGFFQDKEMQKNCSACPYGKSTDEKGAKHIEECKGIIFDKYIHFPDYNIDYYYYTIDRLNYVVKLNLLNL